MLTSLDDMNRARQLAETGQHAALVDFLSERPREQIEDSPTLALLYGTAQARLGRHADGKEWVELALERSRARGDLAVEAGALNVRGAMALVAGQIEEAAGYFALALSSAERDGDYATVGKCSNNLGIINSMRGLHAQAVGSYTMALAAFQQAGMDRGIAEVLHNLGIAYRDERDLDRALENANQAVEVAAASEDTALSAVARRGRAEIRILAGDTVSARKEMEQAIGTHRDLGDVVQEAEDQRVIASILLSDGQVDEAEELLRNVINQGDTLGRPQLAADAMRDLAHLLRRIDRNNDAREVAHAARALFSKLGSIVEIRRLDDFLE